MKEENEGRAAKKAVVVGCGVAGPVVAMFLQKAGVEVEIYEARPAPDDEAGYFLNLAPNGVAVLDTLGIKDEVLGYGTPTTSIVFLNHRGKRLGALSETTILLKRGLLNKALREAAERSGVPIEFGKRLVGVETTAGSTAVARFEDGSGAEGDVLIGCDGIRSRTRRSVMPEAPEPRYSGVIDSGGFTHDAGVPPSDGVFRMTFGAKGFFGYQVVPSGEAYWFENFHQAAEPEPGHLEAVTDDGWREKLLEIHKDDHAPIASIIASTGGRIGRWPNYEMPPLSAWHEGPVCLVGDAAHAMLPSAGQGASLAMEDAVVLARCLRDAPDTERAFTIFEGLRKERVERIAAEARRNSGRKVPTNALTRGIRDLILPFFLKMSAGKAGEACSYRVDWEEPAWPTGRDLAEGKLDMRGSHVKSP